MCVCVCVCVLQVKAILVNIFGGIVDCATVARGIITACKEIKMTLPVVVRLEGQSLYLTSATLC